MLHNCCCSMILHVMQILLIHLRQWWRHNLIDSPWHIVRIRSVGRQSRNIMLRFMSWMHRHLWGSVFLKILLMLKFHWSRWGARPLQWKRIWDTITGWEVIFLWIVFPCLSISIYLRRFINHLLTTCWMFLFHPWLFSSIILSMDLGVVFNCAWFDIGKESRWPTNL